MDANEIAEFGRQQRESDLIAEAQRQERLRIRRELLALVYRGPGSVWLAEINRICPEEQL